MILMDNSVYTRNGDAIPNRFQCINEGVTAIINQKSNDNPETSIGLMLMAGRGKQILSTPTNDTSMIFAQYAKIQIQSTVSISKSIQVAQLAIKHRVNKHQHERIVIFLGSEIKESLEELYVLARSLRKSLVAVDFVNVCCPANVPILQNFLEIVNVDSNCKLVNFEGGLARLVDSLKESGILGGHQTPTGGFQEDVDPELEMVLRISLEEERKRQEELERQKQTNETQSGGMQIEIPKEDDERTHLLNQATEIVKDSPAEIKDRDQEYLKNPAFINTILNDLKLQGDDRKKDDKDKKDGSGQNQDGKNDVTKND